MTYDDIRVVTRGPATWISLDRPETMNAVRPRTYAERVDAFTAADADRGTRCIVLTGTGRGFCAGDDFNEIFFSKDAHPSRRTEATLDRYRNREGAATPVVGAIMNCTKPTIAAVNGPAVGMDLALLCDMRIAASSTKLGSCFVRRGVVGSIGGTYLLPRSIGLSRAMKLRLSGELLTAEQALAMGIESRVVPDAELHAAVDALVDKLSWGAPLAQRAIKRVVRKGMTLDPAALEEYSRLISGELWRTEDHREGVQSHVDRRKPTFTER